MKMKGVVISGIGSGSGKTSISTGLMSSLSKSMKVQPYKVGPDFIDPMYHTVATGRRSRNLDTFMTSADTVRNIVGHSSKDADICIIEGVRGLFEGQSGTDERGSTAEIAKILGLPVLLVIDARSLTRSAAAIINGFSAFDKDLHINGVILNNVSGTQHERKLRDAIDRYCDVEIVGMVRKQDSPPTRERHLGLHTVNERSRSVIEGLECLLDGIDTDRLLDICEEPGSELPDSSPYTEHDCGLKAAIPMDDAYCFYYRDNIECMEAAGMDVRYFSPTEGDPLPDADLYYIGGGYPELHCERISENRDFLEGLRNASEEGRAVIGECGGLMTMCSSIVSADGTRYEMSGIFDGDAMMSGRHGPTYNIAIPNGNNPLFKRKVRGHSFHYSEIVLRREYHLGFDMERGSGVTSDMDGLVSGNSIGSYTHQHALSNDDWLSDVIETCMNER